ncbi:MAG: hypothetical protein K6E51_11720 [Treponema sp.]|nr:hypothetical protein [Treponema sp.]
MCWKCGKTIDTSLSIYRSSTCPVCGWDLHSCRNCKFYAPGSHYDCHETVDELIRDKEKANFCDSFAVRSVFTIDGDKGSDAAQKARDAFASLFGGSIVI